MRGNNGNTHTHNIADIQFTFRSVLHRWYNIDDNNVNRLHMYLARGGNARKQQYGRLLSLFDDRLLYNHIFSHCLDLPTLIAQFLFICFVSAMVDGFIWYNWPVGLRLDLFLQLNHHRRHLHHYDSTMRWLPPSSNQHIKSNNIMFINVFTDAGM